MARVEALPITAARKGEYRSVSDGKWTKSETAAELAWLGSALVANTAARSVSQVQAPVVTGWQGAGSDESAEPVTA